MKKTLLFIPFIGFLLCGCGEQEDAATVNAVPPLSPNAAPIPPSKNSQKGKVTLTRPTEKMD